MNWVEFVLGWGCLSLAALAQMYREQRNDLAAYIVYTHPEDFE